MYTENSVYTVYGWYVLTTLNNISQLGRIIPNIFNHLEQYLSMDVNESVGKDYPINGYGSIPIDTIFSGMNIHESQLFWCSPDSPGVQGFDPSPYGKKMEKNMFQSTNLRYVSHLDAEGRWHHTGVLTPETRHEKNERCWWIETRRTWGNQREKRWILMSWWMKIMKSWSWFSSLT